MDYRYRETTYRIAITQTHATSGGMTVAVDGVMQMDGAVMLVDDGREHRVDVSISAARA
jgi:hypothetical protein